MGYRRRFASERSKRLPQRFINCADFPWFFLEFRLNQGLAGMDLRIGDTMGEVFSDQILAAVTRVSVQRRVIEMAGVAAGLTSRTLGAA
jgi:hypothetical protein